MKHILILGATSAIATACARQWAVDKSVFFLVGRDDVKLHAIAADLRVRGANGVTTYLLDMNQFAQHAEMLDVCAQQLPTIDIALVAHGTLPDQKACERDPAAALDAFTTNGLSVIVLLTLLANRMEAQRSGTIAVLCSVAADRGRPSNYVYGTAKAAVSTFCEGLCARLAKANVHMLTVKPGFVDTPMTQGLNLPSLLLATPENVARDIVRAVARRKNTLYTPWFWVFIMCIIRAIPTTIFKKLNL